MPLQDTDPTPSFGGFGLGEGSRVRLHIGRDRFTATVVEFRPTEALTLRVKGPGFLVHHAYRLRPDDDKTTVAIDADYRGILGRLAARFMRGSVERDLRHELEAIRSAAEADRSD